MFNCPISSGQVLKCKLPSPLNVLQFSKSPFFSNRHWNFSNGPYFEHRAPIFTIFFRPNYSAKKKKNWQVMYWAIDQQLVIFGKKSVT